MKSCPEQEVRVAAVVASRSLAAELVSLVAAPAETYPRLLEQRHMTAVLSFAAISGIYVAYVLFRRLNLGDALGFWPAAVGLVFVGAGLGLLALAFMSWVLSWSTRAAGGVADMEKLSGVFGYATWPFLLLLCVLVPLELGAYGTALFSAARPSAPTLVPIVATTLEALTILLWLYLMVRGEAVAAAMSEIQAAKTLGLTFIRMAAIAVLFVLISFVSFMI